MVSVSWLLSLYYNVIIAHCLFYLGASFTSQLPWEFCGQTWNTANCSEFIPKAANITRNMTGKIVVEINRLLNAMIYVS